MATAEIEFRGTDRFALKRRLGAGGMGIVYEVHDREQDALLALKTLKNVDAQSLYRLKQEFRALQDLQHPNLVTLGELIEDSGHWFFTMELIKGRDFLSWVRPGLHATIAGSRAGDTMPIEMSSGDRPIVKMRAADDRVRFDEPRLRDALGQLVAGLCALHRAGKVHRDIKPSNILVTGEGRVVLLDFGLAVDAREQRDPTERHVVGTAVYMAPEQAASKAVGPQADWYSVGVLLYEALTGMVPFQGSPLAVLMSKQQAEPPPPSDVATAVPDDLDELCEELLRFDPDERPDGAALLRRLAVDGPTEHERAATVSSHTTSTPFVGRGVELDALSAAFARAHAGEEVTVFVRGESGVGKTALIRHFLDTLAFEHDDLVILKGRCYERESVPYKGIDGVVDALTRYLLRLPRADAAALLPRSAALLPQVFPVLGRVEQIATAPRASHEIRDPRELRNRVFAALRELLARIADRHPLVMVIDDLQWADADSLLLLEDLLCHGESPALLAIASLRTGKRAVADRFSGPTEQIVLDRLPPAEAVELARLLLRHQLGGNAEAAQAIADEAAGHPLFIDELIRYFADAEGGRTGTLRLDDAIVGRANRLDPGAARLLQLIALAGAPVRQSVVCQAAELGIAEATPPLSLLRVAHLVRATGVRGADHIEPYHDRVREAVVARLSDDQRRRCHERLAIALEAADQPIRSPEMLVRHLEGAGRIDDATQRAEQAARRARKGLAFERAAQLYRTALRLGSYDADKRRKLLIRIGETLANAGRGLESAEAYLEAADGADPATRLECQRQSAEQLLTTGHIERGMTALEAVLAEVGERLPGSATRTIMSVLWSSARLRLRGLGFKERHESEIPARELTRLDVYKSVAHGIAILDPIRGADFQLRGLRLSLAAGEPMRAGRALCENAGFLAAQGHVARSRAVIETAGHIIEGRDEPYLSAIHASAHGFVDYFAGDLRPAIELLYAAEIDFLERTVGANWELKTTRLAQLWVLRRLGTFAELGERFDHFIIDAVRRGDRHMETSVRWACNDVWLARDDPDAAAEDLESAPWSPPEGRFHLQHYYGLRARTELDLYLGRGGDALDRHADGFAGLKRSMLLRIADIRPETNYVIARCALAAGDLRRVARLARALRREHISFATVWAHLLDTALLAARGDDDATRRGLRDCIDVADDAGMQLAAACARRRLGPRVGGDEGAALTAAAEQWMADQRIADPERMTELIAPGLAV